MKRLEWTDTEIEALRVRRNNREENPAIAAAMGKSLYAVAHKVGRLASAGLVERRSTSRVRDRRNLDGFVTDNWPLSKLEELCDGWRAGTSTVRIGDSLGVTKNAVVGKVHRLVDAGLLEPRASPIVRHGEPTPGEQPPRAPRATLAPLRSVDVVWPPPMPEPPVVPPRSVLAPIVAPRPPVLAPPPGRTAPPPVFVVRKCQFVVDGTRFAQRFCDAPSIGGSSWCHEHGRICVQNWDAAMRHRGAA